MQGGKIIIGKLSGGLASQQSHLNGAGNRSVAFATAKSDGDWGERW